MTFKELQQQAYSEYYPALFLENFWPRGRGRHLLQAIRILWGFLFLAAIIVYSLSVTGNAGLEVYVPKFIGAFAIALSFWMAAGAIHSFYNYYYFKSFHNDKEGRPRMSFELARMLYQTSSGDILRGFLESDEGFKAMMRTGISKEEIANFIAGRKKFIDDAMFAVQDDDGYVSASEYALAILDADPDYAKFLFAHSVQKKDFIAIMDWVIEREIGERAKLRWWSRDVLGRIPGLGKNWSYGQTYTLERYERPIPLLPGNEYEFHDVYGSKELQQLEDVLVRSRSANALIVSNDNAGNVHIIARLNRMIENGTVLPVLAHKRLIMLDTNLITAKAKTKSDFDAELIKLLREAHNAGNVILVFADFPAFLSAAETIGADIVQLMDPYLLSSDLQIIGLSDTARYHSKIEINPALMERFEHILVEAVDESNSIRVLENEVVPIEQQTGMLFSYPAIVGLVEAAERYFPDAIMPDKAIDLLFEIAPKVAARGKLVVHRDDVLDLVKAKTGIPVGDLSTQERDKLLHLETILHQRIIGQDEAVDAIANAVRRARSGINNPNRPLASFLFLGPTGVGKTETTKALGDIFFGKDSQILRLDMSEYSTPDALSKLIGSFASGRSGVLADIIREHPYGVLLLDEFEKTTPEVMNLFLQVLDEGFFSDKDGKKINTRNLLIIATSNAGSDMIWDAVKQGESLDRAKDMIIDSIIKSHIMKPELMNRFDGVIIFHPLGSEQLDKIATLQLEKLKKRLAERGINLAITDDLVKYLMQFGTDPKFGARPMNRAIQDKIEQVIAEKMIRGDVVPGSEIVLTSQDLK